MLPNRYLVVMNEDDLVQLAEAVNPVGHQQNDMALQAFQVSQNLLFSCRVNGRKWSSKTMMGLEWAKATRCC